MAYWHWVQMTTRYCGRISRRESGLSMSQDTLRCTYRHEVTTCSLVYLAIRESVVVGLVCSDNSMLHAGRIA